MVVLEMRPAGVKRMDRGGDVELSVEMRRERNAAGRPAAQRSPWLSKAVGLGFLQSQLGDSLMTCVKHDYVEGVSRIVGKGRWRWFAACILFLLLVGMDALFWSNVAGRQFFPSLFISCFVDRNRAYNGIQSHMGSAVFSAVPGSYRSRVLSRARHHNSLY